MVLHPIASATDALGAFLALAPSAPPTLGLNVALITAPPAPFVPPDLVGKPAVALAAAHIGALEDGAAAVAPVRAIPGAVADTFGPMPYTALQSMTDDSAPPGLQNVVRSELLGPLDAAGIDSLVGLIRSATSPMSTALLRIMGGAIADVPADATAFSYRDSAGLLMIAATWPDPSDDFARHSQWTRDSLTAMQPWSAGGGYVNLLSEEGPERIRDAYAPGTWDRLVALKRQFDPDNVFRLNENIPPN
jgi:FAD/FMN-containing dehydrogenase